MVTVKRREMSIRELTSFYYVFQSSTADAAGAVACAGPSTAYSNVTEEPSLQKQFYLHNTSF